MPAPAPAESDSQAKADSAAGDLDSAIKKAESGWDYSREHGPNTWAGLCKVC
jgi:carbonic anhydrase